METINIVMNIKNEGEHDLIVNLLMGEGWRVVYIAQDEKTPIRLHTKLER